MLLGAGLALRAMPVPAGAKDMPHRAAAVAPGLGLAAAKSVPGQPGWPVNAQDIGQFDMAGASPGLMPGAQA
jgi:hypothetical protein